MDGYEQYSSVANLQSNPARQKYIYVIVASMAMHAQTQPVEIAKLCELRPVMIRVRGL